MFPSVFDPATNVELINRINKITPEKKPDWGKMSADQMFAHVNVGYDIAYGKVDVSYNWFMKKMLGLFVRPMVVGDKPYKKNGQTAPIFLIEGGRDFDAEKTKLVEYIKRVESDGIAFFKGKDSSSFGKMTVQECSNQFWKHLDHHLTQFGV